MTTSEHAVTIIIALVYGALVVGIGRFIPIVRDPIRIFDE
jgi:hypothetical protein